MSEDKKNMYTLFDHQIFSLQRVGGISRYFVELAQRLPHSDSSVETAVLAPFHINAHLSASSIRVFGLHVPAFPGKHRLLPPLNRMIGGLLHRRIKPDIVHETYYFRALTGAAKDIPRVLTVYDMIHERYPQMFAGADIAIPRHKASAVARADHIIAISNNTRDDLIRFLKVPAEKVTVIPLASSLSASPGDANVNRRNGRRFLLYVGMRGGVKNFSRLLSAFIDSAFLRRNYDLICAGGGPFSAAEYKHIRQGGVAGRVRYIEADDVLLKSLYTGAELLVYPSLYEGFGLPLLEAMGCGCPVVCSSTSSMPEIAGEAACYFDPENTRQMRDVIEGVLESDDERKQMQQRGFTRVKLFSWEKCVRQTAQVYRALL